MKKDISIPENLQSEIKWMTDWREAGLKDKELHELHLRNKLFVRRLIKRKKRRLTMIDIPLGKALVPVEDSTDCQECFFWDKRRRYCVRRGLNCTPELRQDGKNVIFKLADYIEPRGGD